MKSFPVFAGFFGLAATQSWPNGPFTTSGRDIIDASGNVVTYAGANWPGAADVMIPEGLQYQSVANIVAQIKSAGMNVIRLTYAIELIDQIYENNGVDVPISTAFVEALGEENGTAVYQEVLAANPDFAENITRLEACIHKISKGERIWLILRYTRSSMLSLPSVRRMRFMFTSITTFPRARGAAAQRTGMPGGETPTSPSPTGREGLLIWLTTFVPANLSHGAA